MRLIRWAISVAIVQGLALIALAAALPGFELDIVPSVGIVALGFTLAQLVSWPILYRVAARIHPLLFPFLSFILSGTVALLIAQGFYFLSIAARPYVRDVQTGILITLGLTASYTLFGGLFSLRDLDAYEWFVLRGIRRTFRNENADQSPGIMYIEIDGLAAPLLERAMNDGWMPNLAKWQEDGEFSLNEWETDLSSQTSASQAGILLGSNEGIPAFRWYDKPAGKLMVSSSLRTAQELEQRLSTNNGLLSDGGASRWNVFSGDAPDSLLTYSTLSARDRGGSAGYIGLFASPYLIGRTLILFLGDIVRERWQAFSQWRLKISPRVRRTWKYAIVRAATTTIMMEMSQYMLLADMYRGIPSTYYTIFAYDEVAHHSGIDRDDAFKVLTRIDTMLGLIRRESEKTPRPYHLVIVSDHGQSMGATFKQRNRHSLGDLVQRLVDPSARVEVYDSLVEEESRIQVTFEEAISGSEGDRTSRVIRRAFKNFSRGDDLDSDVVNEPEAERSDMVVLASGNLGLISFPKTPERLTYEEITDRYPLLIPGILVNDDIGFVMVRSEDDGALVLGSGGIYYLDDDGVAGENPLALYGERAAQHLRRTDGFANAPDILVMSAVDSETGAVYAFEELVGSHGGLGGFQTRPFVYHPVELPFPEEPVVGAAAVHRVLKSWITSEQGESLAPGSTPDALPEPSPVPDSIPDHEEHKKSRVD